MAADVEQQRPEVRVRPDHHQEHDVRGHRREDDRGLVVLEDRGLQATNGGGMSEFVARLEDAGHVGSDRLAIQPGIGLIVDQEAIATEHGHGLDAIEAAKGRNEVANGRHRISGKG